MSNAEFREVKFTLGLTHINKIFFFKSSSIAISLDLKKKRFFFNLLTQQIRNIVITKIILLVLDQVDLGLSQVLGLLPGA